jgi:hypothetical protein
VIAPLIFAGNEQAYSYVPERYGPSTPFSVAAAVVLAAVLSVVVVACSAGS